MGARLVAALLLLVACQAGGPSASPAGDAGVAPGRHRVGGEFAAFYEAHGGERVFGAPLTGVRDDDGVRVQYFENARLEFRPGDLPGHRVRLSPLLALRDRPPDPPGPTPAAGEALAVYYAATGHTVRDQFLSFYDAYGGPSVFGYPLTEVITDNGRQVQYFENAVFYWDAEAPPGECVKLAPMGAMALGLIPSWWERETPRVFANGLVVSGPLRDFYETYGDAAVFGLPLTNAVMGAGGDAVQVFENVRMEQYLTAGGARVRLAPLGKALAPAGQPTPAAREGRCFAETGYCLARDFLAFFDAHGGAAVFGSPVSPVIPAPEDGGLIQYLERARFEWDAAQRQVRLSPLGRWLMEGRIPGYSPP